MAFFRSLAALSKLRSRVESLKKLKTEHGKIQLGNITVDMVLGGMRGMTGLLWETSLLDPDEGIRFRGLSIPECQKVLPAEQPDGEPLPEGLLWLLLTGKVPSKQQVDALSKELQSRATVPDYAYRAIDALPKTAHLMTQFTTGIMALQLIWDRAFGLPLERPKSVTMKWLQKGSLIYSVLPQIL